MLALLRRNRDFAAHFAGQVISYGGDWFALVAILGVVSDITNGSAPALAGIFVSQMIPSFVLSPFAGPVADRFNRKFVMIVTSLLAALASLGFLLIAPGRLWIAYLAQIAVSSLAAFFAPAAGAALANIVDSDDLPTAIHASNSLWGIMLAVGAAVGAVFTNAFGRNAAFVANAASFALAAVVITQIHRPTNAATTTKHSPVRPLHDSVSALRYAKGDETLLALLFAKGGVGLAGGVVALLTNLAIGRYHGGDGAVGTLLAARGVGVVLGPLIAKRFITDRAGPIVTLCGYSCLLYGVAYLGVSASPVLLLAAFGVMVAHLGGGTQWALSSYGIQARAVESFRGRVLAADMALVMLASTVSYGIGSVLKEAIGTGPAIAVLAAVSLLWGVGYLRITAAIRQRDELLSGEPST